MIDKAIEAVRAEVESAARKFRPFNSAHEGYGVLLEEVDELWEEVKVKQTKRDKAKMRAEAVQVAAMAIRFIVDVCDGETVDDKPLDRFARTPTGHINNCSLANADEESNCQICSGSCPDKAVPRVAIPRECAMCERHHEPGKSNRCPL